MIPSFGGGRGEGIYVAQGHNSVNVLQGIIYCLLFLRVLNGME